MPAQSDGHFSAGFTKTSVHTGSQIELTIDESNKDSNSLHIKYEAIDRGNYSNV